MAYIINHYNGSTLPNGGQIADGTVDNSTDLKLIGKNYAGYGELQNENFLFLLENFAGGTAPPRATQGQLWFDTGENKLKFFDAASKWRTTGGAEVGGTEPSGLSEGDFWYDTDNLQLWAKNPAGSSTPYTLIGPQGVEGAATTQLISKNVKDTDNVLHAVVQAVTNGQPTFVIWSAGIGQATTPFTLHASEDLVSKGFTNIHQGITLAYTNDDIESEGQTINSNHRFWGTSSDADRLGGADASKYVRNDLSEISFDSLVKFSDYGYTVGDTSRLEVYVGTGPESGLPIIKSTGAVLKLKTQISSGPTAGEKTPLVLNGPDVEPGYNWNTVVIGTHPTNLGSDTKRFNSIYAHHLFGTADDADYLNIDGTARSASYASSPNTIVARDSSQNISANLFNGTATSANYADLAEKYLADAEYEVGTVLMVGGDKEVTACQVGFRAVGPVSEKPAYMMNSELEGGTYIALKGRVPVKVTGSVIKGQRLVAGQNGTAQAAYGNTADYFAIALESNDEAGVKVVECLIL